MGAHAAGMSAPGQPWDVSAAAWDRHSAMLGEWLKQSTNEMLGGQIAALVLPEGLFRQHKATGRLRVLATSGAQRTTLLPDVPTLVEQGFRELVVREWFAFFMAGRTAPSLVDAGSRALQAAIAQPSLGTAFAESGMVAMASTPAALASRIAAEQKYWEPIIRAIGVRAE